MSNLDYHLGLIFGIPIAFIFTIILLAAYVISRKEVGGKFLGFEKKPEEIIVTPRWFILLITIVIIGFGAVVIYSGIMHRDYAVIFIGSIALWAGVNFSSIKRRN